ncbi:MAG: hypothetical protein ACXITR_00525 [Cyanobacterium sp.]
MNHVSLDKPVVDTNIVTPPIKDDDASDDIALFHQRLVRNFIAYVKLTGDCSYQNLLNSYQLQEEEVTAEQQEDFLSDVEDRVSIICLNMKDIVKQFAESLPSGNQVQSLRNSLEGVEESTPAPYLITTLKEEHKKLSYCLDSVVNVAKSFNDKSLVQFIRDLTYFHQYIQYHAQPTKIQHDLTQIGDLSLYLRRLNEYLDLIPETVDNIIDAIARLSE